MSVLSKIKRLLERMTFNQLLRYSEPKRVTRSLTVRGPPLKIETFSDSVFHVFNFKSFPSTTGKRHHGYIKFFKPRSPRPIDKLECLVDCDCPDFKFRWAWANKQRGSSLVGASSMNRAWNRAPRITNPTSTPGLCKHLIHLKEYIIGLSSSRMFGQGSPDDSSMMSTLMRYADQRWTDTPEQDQEDRDREAAVRATQLQRNRGQLPSNAPPPPADQVGEPENPDNEPENVNPDNPENTNNLGNADGFSAPSVEPPDDDENELHDSVHNMDMNYSATLKLIEELEASEQDAEFQKPAAPDLEVGKEGGAEDEDDALTLLRQIRDFLSDIQRVLAPEPDDNEVKGEEGNEGEEGEGSSTNLPADANSYAG